MHPLEGIPMYELGQAFNEQPSKKLAWEITQEFCKRFNQKEAEDCLWLAVTTLMQTENENIDHHQRSIVLFFFEYYKLMNKAIHYLNDLEKKKV